MDGHTKTIHLQLCLSLVLRHKDMDEQHFTVKEQKICTEYLMINIRCIMENSRFDLGLILLREIMYL